MAYALVGALGPVVGTGLNNTVTPTWDAGAARTSGNLLIIWADIGALPPSGWTQVNNFSNAPEIWFRVATGGDAAPSFSAAWAMAAEFSGGVGLSPLDQNNLSANVASSPVAATCNVADAQAGELVPYAFRATYSTAATKTITTTLNNGMVGHEVNNNAASVTEHYLFGWATTTGTSIADSVSVAFTTTKISAASAALGSFKLPPAVPVVVPFTPGRMPLGA